VVRNICLCQPLFLDRGPLPVCGMCACLHGPGRSQMSAANMPVLCVGTQAPPHALACCAALLCAAGHC
jgi:hypothetical protein